MSRETAVREVRRAVERTGEPRQAFAKRAGVDPGTLSDFLDGARWPQAPTRAKIERALGWAPGRIADIADSVVAADEDAPDVLAAIMADKRLLPEARAHLINQYELLLRLHPPTADDLLVEQDRRRQQAQVEVAGRAVLEQVRDESISTSRRRRKD